MLQSKEQNQRWPTSGLHNPCRLGVPNGSKRGTKLGMAHKLAGVLDNPSRLGGPQFFTAGNKIRSSPHVGRVVA